VAELRGRRDGPHRDWRPGPAARAERHAGRSRTALPGSGAGARGGGGGGEGAGERDGGRGDGGAPEERAPAERGGSAGDSDTGGGIRVEVPERPPRLIGHGRGGGQPWPQARSGRAIGRGGGRDRATETSARAGLGLGCRLSESGPRHPSPGHPPGGGPGFKSPGKPGRPGRARGRPWGGASRTGTWLALMTGTSGH
jgi:hypothetical protein